LYDQSVYRKTRDTSRQSSPTPLTEIYFPSFIVPRADEVFVDCGAADGDTIQQFLDHRRGKYAHIVAFEPDADNFYKLTQHDIPRCVYHHSAVGESNSPVPFRSLGNTDSNISATAAGVVPCTRLDDVCWPSPPTFIKMDIEGYEKQALWGARRILQTYRPVLAICAYHWPADLWEIPQLIHMMVPEYELRLRRYMPGWIEIVWYAVPPERLVAE
jgi:FkbM family methyltransferase